jgi:predicted nuclease of predicted toxin-antitoxin system
MKILLDECLPVDLRHSFPNHDAHTVQWARLKGKKNGELLRAAEVSATSRRIAGHPAEHAGYDVLLTVDQGIPHQQRLAERKLAIILLRSRTNQVQDLLPMVDAILQALDTIRPGQIVGVSSSE